MTQGATTLCTLTLSSGKGTCALGATALSASTTKYPVTATYNGDANFAAGATGTATLKVTKAAKATATVTLALSPANVAFGNEDAVTYTATVTSPETTPGGTVTITGTVAGTPTTICTVTTLVNGVGSCTPTGQQTTLSVGAHTLTATYNGDGNVTGGSTGKAKLTVAATATASTLSITPATAAYGQETAVTFRAPSPRPPRGSPPARAPSPTCRPAMSWPPQ